MKLYEYMVVYSHDRGTGRVCITREKEIESYSDIESIDETIRNYNGLKSVIVIDFKLLRVYEKENKEG